MCFFWQLTHESEEFNHWIFGGLVNRHWVRESANICTQMSIIVISVGQGAKLNINEIFLFTHAGCELHKMVFTMNFCLLLIIKPVLSLDALEHILHIFGPAPLFQSFFFYKHTVICHHKLLTDDSWLVNCTAGLTVNTLKTSSWYSLISKHFICRVVIQVKRPVTSECSAEFKSCHKDMEASKVTFLSLLNPDSAVGVVTFPSAALQVCCLVQIWEVLTSKGWTFLSLLIWKP